jgi:hypothetical protein
MVVINTPHGERSDLIKSKKHHKILLARFARYNVSRNLIGCFTIPYNVYRKSLLRFVVVRFGFLRV